MNRIVLSGLGIATMAASIALVAQAPAGKDRDRMIAACAGCHGASGEGIEARSAPRLAGMSPAYLALQLKAYADGTRGGHGDDPYGSQMAVIAKTLRPEDIAEASRHYGSLTGGEPFNTLDADPAKGKAAFEGCTACHGADGMGQEASGAPRIAGQSDWYLLHSLQLYRSGARGGDPNDAPGQTMAAAAKAIEDEASLRDVAAYAAGLSAR